MYSDMVRPKRLECQSSDDDKTFSRFIAEPLERGFATTVGNSLRRYLLSSIPGASVVAMKIEGVHHEFSTLVNVFEDVSEIILNIKEIIVEQDEKELKTLTINQSGKKEVTAGDIECPDGVRILNPDLRIATLTDKSSSLKMELFSKVGRGYVPSEDYKHSDEDIDIIPVDASFAPVRKVNFIVEKTRVGDSTDYDKLTMEVWTNGTIDPEDAISMAAKLQRDHMLLFMNIDDEIEVPVIQESTSESRKPSINLNRSVEELELSVRSYNCLQKAEIKTIVELVEKTDSDMLQTRNFGRKSLNEIKDILIEMGLKLGMTKEEIAQCGGSE